MFFPFWPSPLIIDNLGVTSFPESLLGLWILIHGHQFDIHQKTPVFFVGFIGGVGMDLPMSPPKCHWEGRGPLQQVDYLLNSQEFTHMIMLDADAALVRHQVTFVVLVDEKNHFVWGIWGFDSLNICSKQWTIQQKILMIIGMLTLFDGMHVFIETYMLLYFFVRGVAYKLYTYNLSRLVFFRLWNLHLQKRREIGLGFGSWWVEVPNVMRIQGLIKWLGSSPWSLEDSPSLRPYPYLFRGGRGNSVD